MRGSWLAGLVVAVGLLVAPATAAAHAQFRSAEPTPSGRVDGAPASVRVVLSSPVEDEFLRLTVVRADGALVSGPPRRDPRDPRAIVAPIGMPAGGVLTVAWRVLSRDGHATSGTYAFGAGVAPGAGADPRTTGSDHGALAVLVRFLALVGPLGLLGLAALGAAVVGPAVHGGGILVPGEDPTRRERFRQSSARALGAAAPRWWAVWWVLIAGWAAGVLLVPAVTLAELGEGPSRLGPLLGGTRLGQAWGVQAAGVAMSLVVSAAMCRRRGVAWLPDRATSAALLGAGPLLGLAAISWSGHASVGSDATPNIAIDLLHNTATAAWIGGLLGLAVLVSPALARLGEDDRVRLGAAVVVRFSTLALTCVAVLVVTGVYRALAEVPIGEVLESGYGRFLVIKLGIFGVLLLGGAYNRMIVHPRLERAALGLDADDRGAGSALRVSVRAELVLACALLVVVAVLVSLPPPG